MPTPYNDIALLLRRAGFGGLPHEINALTAYDLPTVVDKVLDVSGAPPVVAPPTVIDDTTDSWERWVPALHWWFDRAATTPAPLAEKMVLFWQGHFTSSGDECHLREIWYQHQLFRNQGLGSIHHLAQAVAVDPAMLRYLDNHINVVGRPNENFARELMELFVLGVDQYSQADVVEAARAWTGHGLSSDRKTYVFNSTKHDTGLKTFFGITKNWDGPDIIDEMFTGSKAPIAAAFLAEKLWTFFAYPDPETAVVQAVADTLLAKSWSTKEALRTVFTRPEFYSTKSLQLHVRNPSEFILAAMRYTGLPTGKAHPDWYSARMGQRLYYPPDVSGWKGGEAWLSTSTMWAKGGFVRHLSWKAREAGVLADTRRVSIQTAVQRAFDTFGIDRPTLATRAAIESAISAERTARGWGEQVNLLTLTMLSPEFQVG